MEAKARLANAELKARKRVACEERAFRIVERFVEDTVDEDKLKNAARFLDPSYYADIVEERSIGSICGYPICSKQITNVKKQKYHISLKTKKVYDISERKKFCSNQCYRASKFYEQQLPTSPVWVRDEEEQLPVILLSSDNKGSCGAVVIDSRSVRAHKDHEHGINVKDTSIKDNDILVTEQNRLNSEISLNGQANSLNIETIEPLFIDTREPDTDHLSEQLSEKCNIHDSEVNSSAVDDNKAEAKNTKETDKVENGLHEEETVHYLVPDKTDTAGILFSSFDFVSVTTPRQRSILKDPSKAIMGRQRKKSVHFEDSKNSTDISQGLPENEDANSDTEESKRHVNPERILENNTGKLKNKPPLKRINSFQLTLTLENKILQNKKGLVVPELPNIKKYGSNTVDTARNATDVKGGAKVVFRGTFGDTLKERSVGGDVNICDALKNERDAIHLMTGQKESLTQALQKQFEEQGVRLETAYSQMSGLYPSDISQRDSEALFLAYRSQSSGVKNRRYSLAGELNSRLQDKINHRRESLTTPPLPKVQSSGSKSVNTADKAHQAKGGTKTVMKSSLGKLLKTRSSGDFGTKLRDILYSERDDIQIVGEKKNQLLRSLGNRVSRNQGDASNEILLTNGNKLGDSSTHIDYSIEETPSQDGLVDDVFEEIKSPIEHKSVDSKVNLLEKLLDKRENLAGKLGTIHRHSSSVTSNVSIPEEQGKQDHHTVTASFRGDSSLSNQMTLHPSEQPAELNNPVDSTKIENTDEMYPMPGDEKTNETRYQDVSKTEIKETSAPINLENKEMDVHGVRSSEDITDNYTAYKSSSPKPTPTRTKGKNSKRKISTLTVIMKCISEWKTSETVSFLCQKEMTDAEAENVRQPSAKSKTVGSGRKDLTTDKKNVTEDEKLFDLKVSGFYEKGFYSLGTGNSKQPHKCKEEETRVPVLPYVDSHAQLAIRRKIVLDKLNKVLSDLLGPLNLSLRSISLETRQLVHTFNLTSKNITFKTPEWTFVGYLVLKMLSLRLPVVEEAFSREYMCHFYRSMVLSAGSTDSEVGNFVSYMSTESNNLVS